MEKTIATFYSRENGMVAVQVKEALANGIQVRWVNEYETFYGMSWFGWVQNQLKDIDCDIKILGWASCADMPRTILITPKH